MNDMLLKATKDKKDLLECRPDDKEDIKSNLSLPSIDIGFGRFDLKFPDRFYIPPYRSQDILQHYPNESKRDEMMRFQPGRSEGLARTQGHHVATYWNLIVDQLCKEEGVDDLTNISTERLLEIFMSDQMDRPSYTVNMRPSQKRKEKLKHTVQDPAHARVEAQRRVRHNDYYRDLNLISPDIAVRVGRIVKNNGRPKPLKDSRRSPSKDDVLSQALIVQILAKVIITAIYKQQKENKKFREGPGLETHHGVDN